MQDVPDRRRTRARRGKRPRIPARTRSRTPDERSPQFDTLCRTPWRGAQPAGCRPRRGFFLAEVGPDEGEGVGHWDPEQMAGPSFSGSGSPSRQGDDRCPGLKLRQRNAATGEFQEAAVEGGQASGEAPCNRSERRRCHRGPAQEAAFGIPVPKLVHESTHDWSFQVGGSRLEVYETAPSGLASGVWRLSLRLSPSESPLYSS